MTSKYKPEPKSRIPEFASREEEAEFFDTHDMADYWDEFQPVEARFAKNLSGSLTLRRSPDVLAELNTRAKEKGVRPAELVQRWIQERIGKADSDLPKTG